MSGTIFSILTALLILYYAVLICLDLFMKPGHAAEESVRPEEAEIDISEEAASFRAVEILRDNHTGRGPGKTPAVTDTTLRKPLMTNGIPVEMLVSRARNISGTEDVELAGLGLIVARCESAE